GGVAVTLIGTDDLGKLVSTNLMTAADGSYAFLGLRPGTYQISEIQPALYLDGKDTTGTQGGFTLNDQFTNVVLSAGDLGTDNDFGAVLPAAVKGFVYYDAKNDGTKQGNEPGIGGTTVTLTGTGDLGNAVSMPLATAGDGSYDFESLRPGAYKLVETQPAVF